jgi:uncharacterized protein YbjT (DUF2867 family)
MILVTGGTGFVGRKIVHELRAEEREVRCLVRRPDKAGTLKSWGCELAEGDVTDPASLRRAVDGCETVVQLVAIIAGKPKQFERVMEQGTRDLVDVAEDAGVSRFVLMSALGTTEETKDLVPYYHAKWTMEETVRGSCLDHVIFRPSFVFGPDGGVLPMFVRQVRWSPVTPIVGDGTRRLQPIWGDDVAAYFARGVQEPEALNRTFELGGPDVITWNDLFDRIRRVLDKHRRTVHIPIGLIRPMAAVTERLPKPPVTRDQLTMLEAADNVVTDDSAVQTFGLPLLAVDDQIRRSV